MPFKGRQKGCFATFLWKDGVFFPHLDWRIPFLFKSAEKEMENEQKEKKDFFAGDEGTQQKNRAAPMGKPPFKCRDNRLLYFFFSTAALMKLMNRGWGFSTVLLYSGWNCVPTYHVHLGTSTISTRLLVGLIPVLASPFASNSFL